MRWVGMVYMAEVLAYRPGSNEKSSEHWRKSTLLKATTQTTEN